jgi:hypothetical protein
VLSDDEGVSRPQPLDGVRVAVLSEIGFGGCSTREKAAVAITEEEEIAILKAVGVGAVINAATAVVIGDEVSDLVTTTVVLPDENPIDLIVVRDMRPSYPGTQTGPPPAPPATLKRLIGLVPPARFTA